MDKLVELDRLVEAHKWRNEGSEFLRETHVERLRPPAKVGRILVYRHHSGAYSLRPSDAKYWRP